MNAFSQYDVPRLDVPPPEDWSEDVDGPWVAPMDWDALLNSYRDVPRPSVPEAPKPRAMSVRDVLEWAFAVEHADLDYGGITAPFQATISATGKVAEIGALQARIDTSPGRSLPCDAAQDVALCVSHTLGSELASLVRMYAITLSAPDSMADAVPQCVPRAWQPNRVGRFAKSTSTGKWYWGKARQGRRVRRDIMWTPVTFTHDPALIARSRARYTLWWGALADLRAPLKPLLSPKITVTDALPPRKPWEK